MNTYAIIIPMSIVEIENEIKKLPAEKVGELVDWLANYHSDLG